MAAAAVAGAAGAAVAVMVVTMMVVVAAALALALAGKWQLPRLCSAAVLRALRRPSALQTQRFPPSPAEWRRAGSPSGREGLARAEVGAEVGGEGWMLRGGAAAGGSGI